MKSILQNEKECFITGDTENIHDHHIFGGANRRISEQNGFKVYLRADLHNMSNKGVHFDRDFDLRLKKLCQEKYEETHTREEWMRLIRRNYLD